jgi:hypothetical protein
VRIIVNDANILIDLVELGLLKQFFSLPFEFQTTGSIIDELYDYQQEELTRFIGQEQLTVVEFTEVELTAINELNLKKPALSTQDCSAFFQARKTGGILVTGDNTLKKYAKTNHIEAYGHLWVLDRLVEEEILSGPEASLFLTTLTERINPRLGLPDAECQRRHAAWLFHPH